MGEASAIAWTDHTFNPWWGCTKASPGCDHCYAARDARMFGYAGAFDGGTRRYFGTSHFRFELLRLPKLDGAKHLAVPPYIDDEETTP